MKVMIDPGHGPYDINGGPGGYLEQRGMWKLANYLQDELEALGVTVLLTRGENETLSLWERGARAALWGADLFISEHSNASANGDQRGAAAYYSVRIPEDIYLAQSLSAATARAMDTPDLGGLSRQSTTDPNSDYYTVIYSAATGGVPHVILMENGFHDNPQDEAILKTDAGLKAIAKAQAQTIAAYFHLLD